MDGQYRVAAGQCETNFDEKIVILQILIVYILLA